MNTTTKVAKVIHEEGITPQELEEMIKKSSICSHSAKGNRRFHDWIFNISPEGCTDMFKEEITIIGKGHIGMYEDCPKCDSEGCKFCGWNGEVQRKLN